MAVRKKGNKWYTRFQIDGIEYERACKGATTEKDALKCEAVIKGEIMQGNYNFAKSKVRKKLKDALDIYETYAKINKLSYKSDISYIKKIKDYFGENKPLDEITTSDINKFKEFIKTKEVTEKIKILNPDAGKKGVRKKFVYKEMKKIKILSNSTINRHVELLSKMFNLCIAEKIIADNPCKFSGKLRQENFKIRYLTKEEEQRLFNVLETDYSYLEPIILCALQTGMRRSEIFNLKWNQVDFKKEYIEILQTKSGKSRKIPISSRLDLVLKKQLANQINEYIFNNPNTQKPYIDIKNAFRTLLKKADIENFRFHDLRHTVATRLVEKGIDLLVVKDILGHSDIKTTMRYAHPVPERKKLAVDILSSY